MNISRIFIVRPVATTVLVVAIIVFGLIAFRALPVNELPNVDFPTISVTADLPGANPNIMASTVATPLERQFSQISGVDSMSSVNSTGRTRVTLQFKLDRDIDAAAQDVQTAISQSMRRLPEGIDPPTLRKINPADSPILFLALTAKTLPLPALDEFADTHIAQRFSMVSGVAQVQIFGSQRYAVRVLLDPEAMSKRSLGLERVVSAIQNANSNLPSGVLQGGARDFTVKSSGKLQRAENFNNLIVAYKDGMPVRLSDVGNALDGIENSKIKSWLNGERAIILAIYRQPGANTVEVSKNLRALFPEIEASAPPGVRINLVNDRAEFIQSSIHEVEFHLVLSIILVVLVILLFLRNARSTLITALILPTSIIATFGAMSVLGYSLNNLSLMAIILAVGFVVDDAIVVLENITRHMEMGKDRMTAALEGAQEIGFTVLSMTVSLAAVFIPILFMEGMIGRLFREFAVSVGVAVLVSGVISLSMTPMMCSLMLRPNEEHGRVYQMFERGFDAMRDVYATSLRWTMRHRGLMLFGSAVFLVLTVIIYKAVPQGFIPRQDTGVFFGNTRAPEGVPFNDLEKRQARVAAIIEKNPNVEAVMSTAGQGTGGVIGSNIGRIIVRLKPRDERKAGADNVIQQLRREFSGGAQGLRVFMNNPPAIRIGGLISTSDYQLVLQGSDQKQLYDASAVLESRLRESSMLQDVNSSLELSNPEIQIDILRDRAAVLGVSPQQVETALYNAYGGRRISTLYGATDQYNVLLELDPKFQRDINALRSLYVQSSTGQMVPIQAVADIKMGVGPVSVSHYGQLLSVVLSFNLAPGLSIGDAVSHVKELAGEVLPVGVTYSVAGNAQAFEEAFRTLPILLLITILVIYMVLAVLYEHYGHPITILTALPFAGFGALLMLWIAGQELNVFSFVGIILLVGLVKKNGIMMVDFAIQLQREKGLSAADAIVEASIIRFRPIMMTTAAAICATLPLAFGTGTGSEMRQPLGIAVVGGLVFSQMLTLYVTPTFFVSMERAAEFFRRRKSPVPVAGR
ncbi:MAG: efflux RND transporter permease subunit [Betaproteobacteria bacterium]|jgi:HAE1 family hydrophobic/amphiphilic exporter-1|nr:efflux RND transporter permease subunit [Betaproteobacteria bacterium]MDH5341993.1 efflux RND transporter permease subunit [Betaproteobacteria bacterium]